MTDNLRDRIAAVIHKQNVSEYCGTIHPEDVLRLADAVVRELNSRSLIGYQIWNAAEWISVNSGCVPYEIYRSVDGTGGGWRVTVQRIEADDEY